MTELSIDVADDGNIARLPPANQWYYADNMQLTKKDIEEFKFLYAKHYNQDLSDDEAWILAHNLIHFFSLITELPPKKLFIEAKTPSEEVNSCDPLP